MLEKLSSRNRISLSSQPRYVYALIDPRNDEVCYVGVTKNVYSRLSQHVKYASMTDSKGKWITELERLGLSPELEILETINACQGIDRIASEREKHWIHQFLELGAPLLNATNTAIAPRIRQKHTFDPQYLDAKSAPFKVARNEAKLTIEQLSKEAKVSTTFVKSIEKGKLVKVELAVRACRVLTRYLGYEVTCQSLNIKVWGLHE